MSVAATPAHQETLPRKSDIRKRRWATLEQVREVAEWEARQRGVQRELRSDLFENVWAVYGALRKRAAQGVDTTSTRQLARDLYPDVGEDIEAWERKRKSVQRWLRILERGGLIATRENARGSGKTLGLRVELLPVNEVAALSRGCSSAG